MIFVDVDDFKHLNDDRGHAYGDQVLCELGKVLKEAARGEDTCVRYGGDEFCVVLANSTEEQAMSTYSQRIKRLLAERLPNVNISLGVVQTGPTTMPAPTRYSSTQITACIRKTVKNGLAALNECRTQDAGCLTLRKSVESLKFKVEKARAGFLFLRVSAAHYRRARARPCKTLWLVRVSTAKLSTQPPPHPTHTTPVPP